MKSVQPNFVIIVADDLGYGDPSCYGGWIATPELDRMASEGVRFTDFYANGPVCSPTRAALMTGRYQQRCGITGVVTAVKMRGPEHGLQSHHVTFAETLRGAGYRTGIFGKWHLGYDVVNNPVRHGFDEFRGYVGGNVDYLSHVDQAGYADWWNRDRQEPEEGYVTHLVTRHAIEFIHAHRDRPFCVVVAHEAPHYPYQGPGDKAERVEGRAYEGYGSRPDKREAYREMVEEMDKGMGDVLRAIRAAGVEDNTLVVFFSDNGAMTKYGSNGSLRGGKGELWEGGIRVPAIVRWPGRVPAGKLRNTPVMGCDITATVLELAGISAPTDGASLMPVMTGQETPPRTLAWSYLKQSAIRQGQWKLVTRDGQVAGLFDLVADPRETHDLSAPQPERVTSMLAELARWRTDLESGKTV